MKKIPLIILSVISLFPSFAHAAGLNDVILKIGVIINNLVPVIIGLAILGFLWGVAKYVMGGAEDKEKGRTIMIWGIVGLFVMLSFWGLITFLGQTLGITPGGVPIAPPII